MMGYRCRVQGSGPTVVSSSRSRGKGLGFKGLGGQWFGRFIGKLPETAY